MEERSYQKRSTGRQRERELKVCRWPHGKRLPHPWCHRSRVDLGYPAVFRSGSLPERRRSTFRKSGSLPNGLTKMSITHFRNCYLVSLKWCRNQWEEVGDALPFHEQDQDGWAEEEQHFPNRDDRVSRVTCPLNQLFFDGSEVLHEAWKSEWVRCGGKNRFSRFG